MIYVCISLKGEQYIGPLANRVNKIAESIYYGPSYFLFDYRGDSVELSKTLFGGQGTGNEYHDQFLVLPYSRINITDPAVLADTANLHKLFPIPMASAGGEFWDWLKEREEVE